MYVLIVVFSVIFSCFSSDASQRVPKTNAISDRDRIKKIVASIDREYVQHKRDHETLGVRSYGNVFHFLARPTNQRQLFFNSTSLANSIGVVRDLIDRKIDIDEREGGRNMSSLPPLARAVFFYGLDNPNPDNIAGILASAKAFIANNASVTYIDSDGNSLLDRLSSQQDHDELKVFLSLLGARCIRVTAVPQSKQQLFNNLSSQQKEEFRVIWNHRRKKWSEDNGPLLQALSEPGVLQSLPTTLMPTIAGYCNGDDPEDLAPVMQEYETQQKSGN